MDQPIPLLEAERQAGDSKSQKARGNLSPRDCILHQTMNRLPVANQVFLASGTVDIFQEGHSLEEIYGRPEKLPLLCTQETKGLELGR